MKVKLLIGVAAAAFCGQAVAGDGKGSLYGDFRMALMHFDNNGAVESDQDIGDTGSHFGFQASYAEGTSSVFGKYERHLDTDDSVNLTTGVGSSTTSPATGGGDYVREAYAGLRCRFGTLIYGQAETAYSQASRRSDPFYNTGLGDVAGTAGSGFGVGIGPSHGGSVLSLPFRGAAYVNNTAAYTSPAFGGVTVNGALYTDEDSGGSQDHDFGLGAEFRQGGLTLGAQTLDINSGTSAGSAAPNFIFAGGVTAWLAYAGFGTERWGLGFTGERLDGPGIGISAADSLRVSAWFGVAKNTRLAASVASTNEVAEGTSVALGVFHDVLENFTAYAGGRIYDGADGNPDAQALALGASYKFDLSFKTPGTQPP